MPELLRNPKIESDAPRLSADVGSRVWQLRKQRHWSQQYLASRSGLHETEISRLERARRSPRLETIGKVAKAFGMSLSEFLEGVGE